MISVKFKLLKFTSGKMKLAIKLEMLRCFVSVARNGNLSGAGAELGRTTSAVSMMLKQFEDHLGEPLFLSDRKSQLSEVGAYVYEQAAQELEQFDKTVSAIEKFARAETGLVRVAVVPSVAERVMPRVLLQFSKSHAGVRVEQRDMDSLELLRELERGHVDLALGSVAGQDERLSAENILSDNFGLVCRKEHALAQFPSVSWSDLSGEKLIANALSGTIPDPAFQKLYEAADLHVRNTTSLLAMVRSGLGVTVLPGLAVDRNDPDLVFLPLAGGGLKRQILLLKRTDRAVSPAVSHFEKMLWAVVGEMQNDMKP